VCGRLVAEAAAGQVERGERRDGDSAREGGGGGAEASAGEREASKQLVPCEERGHLVHGARVRARARAWVRVRVRVRVRVDCRLDGSGCMLDSDEA